MLPFLNNPKDLDPSYKMDLDLWDCFGRKNLRLLTEEIRYVKMAESMKVYLYTLKHVKQSHENCLTETILMRTHYDLMEKYRIYPAIRQGFWPSRMT